VLVDEIMSDPESALEIGKEYRFVTGNVTRGMEIVRRDNPTEMGVKVRKVRNVVEVEGVYWYPHGPAQFASNIVHPTLNEELIRELKF